MSVRKIILDQGIILDLGLGIKKKKNLTLEVEICITESSKPNFEGIFS